MEESEVLNKLGLFGLTRQEATLYLCMYRYGGITGYEAAKYTGISRSNVYSGLSGLADKGAAYLEQGSASRYIAVPIEKFCENKIRSLMRDKEYLIENIPAMKEQEIGYITITGNGNILDKVIEMILGAEKRIYLSASFSMIREVEKEIMKALEKEIKMVLITDRMPENSEIKEKSICYLAGARGNSIRLIIDSAYALTGELTGKKDDTCLYTGQENFIKVFKDALRNEIKLIELQGGENEKDTICD